MNKRWLVWIPALATMACAAILLFLLVQIDLTRKQLQNDGVLEFNIVQQLGHDLDTLVQMLMTYHQGNQQERSELQEQTILHVDTLSSGIRQVNDSWPSSLLSLKSTQDLLRDINRFLDSYGPSMVAGTTLQDHQVLQISREATDLSSRVYAIDLRLFNRQSGIRDSVEKRLDDLYDALWGFVAFYLVASLMTIMLLLAIFRRAATLREDAVQTRTQLTTALDELTSGDIERRAQNRFMAAASHDLRQPLHALGLYLNVLKRHVPTDQGQVILANIHRSTEALNQLLNSMLDLSRLDAGMVEVNWEQLSLDSIFDHLHQNFLPEANQRELQLDFQYSGLYVRSDQVLLERVLGNLLANAINYTNEGGVSLKATLEGSHVRIDISDTGPGIPADEQEAIFKEYYQLQNPERDRSKGLGLGLSIVKRLSNLLDIELSIVSDEGRGTTFQATLPLAQPNRDEPGALRSKVPRNTDRADLAGLSILVIDDEYDVRDGMKTLLVQHGCDVFIADSSARACEHIIAESWVPDLIIADYRLRDDQTGDMAIEQVREEVNMDVPAMIITGDTSPARLLDATASGFTLLHKPVIADELLNTITRLIGECT
ncbi:MAG: hybrid sensor histidine kinase/response regulator [Granulosicoccus sp.]|nr:hybrid sensor histidine kinase/response regulator [Granulosicoccus sp.]